MNRLHTFVLSLIAVAMMAGCASPPRGPAYGREQELRKALEESTPVKTYGYTIKELRFTPDYQKVLVVFAPPDKSDPGSPVKRSDWEFVLKADDFGRYLGDSMPPFYTPGTANTPVVFIKVSLPPR